MAKLIKCKSCGEEIPSNAKKCRGCGKTNTVRAWKISIIVFSVIAVFIGAAIAGNETKSDNNTDDAYFVGDSVEGDVQEIKSDGIAEKLITFGFTSTEAHEIRETLLLCGVSNIDDCTPTSSTASINDLIAYRAVLDKDRTFWFTIENRKLIYVGLNNYDIFDDTQGGFLISIEDIHIPESEVTQEVYYQLQEIATAAVDVYLVNSSFAYYDAWAVARADDKYMIQGEVYARNKIGVKKWIPFKVWFNYIDGEFVVEAIKIDGQRVK